LSRAPAQNRKENPEQQILNLPDNLAVGVDYGLSPAVAEYMYIMSSEGQVILMKHGFTPGK
jgi:molybdate transport system substrate-binding protein